MEDIMGAAERLLYFLLSIVICYFHSISRNQRTITMLFTKWIKFQNLTCSKFRFGSPKFATLNNEQRGFYKEKYICLLYL